MTSKDSLHYSLYVTDNIKVAINTISETEMHNFFESLRFSKLRQIEDCKPEELTKLQAQVKGITELEGIFKSLKVPVRFSSQT